MTRKIDRILIAEDEADLRNELLEFLRLEGFEVIGAADGKEAFLAARLHQPDLVISDLVMPDWDGARLLLEMQADPQLKNIPIIFLTALVDRKSMRDGMALGAADYVTKPFSLKEVLATIHAQLDKRGRIEQEVRQASRQSGVTTAQKLEHGLLQPVNAIRTRAQTVASLAASNSPEIARLADSIAAEAGNLERRLKNIMLFTDLQMEIQQSLPHPGTPRTEDPASEIRGLVKSLALLRPEIPARVKISGECGALAICRRDFARAVEELLRNALQYSPAVDTVGVRLRENGAMGEIEFHDHGPGLGADEVDAIGAFVSFERRGFETGGIGLGLVLARMIAERYLGSLRIDSRKGGPTLITLAIPLEKTNL